MRKAKKTTAALTTELRNLQRGPTNVDQVERPATPTNAVCAPLISTKRKPLATLDNHLYIQHKATTYAQHWRCVFSRRGCKGRAKSAMGSSQLMLTRPHDHAPVPEEIEKRRGQW
ncbi:hypothetical protein AAVH_23596 [Aphelenchoides avenae]|nr:hypothetical protein AAVH_23596 [Aphelenchus avenae]